MAASVFLQDGSSGPAARRLATIRIADSGAWPDAGGSPLSVVQCSSACREQFTLTDSRAVWLLLVQLGNAHPWADGAAESTQGPREREWGLDARRDTHHPPSANRVG